METGLCTPWRPLAAALLAATAWIGVPAQAALFDDDEARRAILDLRSRVEQQRLAADASLQRQADELRRAAAEDASVLRGSLLDLQNQIESLRSEIARMRGQNEQQSRDISDVQRNQKDVAVGVEERLRKFEPIKVSVDGRDFTADPAESRDYEASMAIFRRGDFPAAQTAFTEFLRRYPQTGYRTSALFWVGNAQYANRDYRGAIANFRALLALAPDHSRAPETLLSIANCQIELKDAPGARRTLEDLMRAYPQSEAASAARERLARVR